MSPAGTWRSLDPRLLALACGAFVVTCDGTLVIGLLPQIAASVDTTQPVAGSAVTVFAVVYAVGGPVLLRARRTVGGKAILVGSLLCFALANLATAAAPNLGALLLARGLAAGCAAAFMPTAAAAAAAMAPPDASARALSVVVAGASGAAVLGVPVGTWAGDVLGWRTVFVVLAVVGGLTALAVRLLPGTSMEAGAQAPDVTVDRRGAGLLLATTLLWAVGSFAFFTYIAAVLHRAAGVGSTGLAVLLLVFGVAGLLGTAAGGWVSDTVGPLFAARSALMMVAVALAAFGLVCLRHAPDGFTIAATTVAVVVYATGTWMMTPAQQVRLLRYGGDQRLMLSLNASALYGGVAIGSAAGARILADGRGTAVLCWVAAAVSLTAVVLTRLEARTERRGGSGSAHGEREAGLDQ